MLSSKHDQNMCFEEIFPYPRINGTSFINFKNFEKIKKILGIGNRVFRQKDVKGAFHGTYEAVASYLKSYV